jgi:NADP-dependent 3-hydroxy acid dehydrogenase YdfG
VDSGRSALAFGDRVVLAAQRTTLLNEIAQEILASGGEAIVATIDVADPDQIKARMVCENRDAKTSNSLKDESSSTLFFNLNAYGQG